jgi:hypothetical protein
MLNPLVERVTRPGELVGGEYSRRSGAASIRNFTEDSVTVARIGTDSGADAVGASVGAAFALVVAGAAVAITAPPVVASAPPCPAPAGEAPRVSDANVRR